jgi:hypothetical protein
VTAWPAAVLRRRRAELYGVGGRLQAMSGSRWHGGGAPGEAAWATHRASAEVVRGFYKNLNIFLDFHFFIKINWFYKIASILLLIV